MRSSNTSLLEWAKVLENAEQYIQTHLFLSKQLLLAHTLCEKLEKEPLSQDNYIHLSENCPTLWIC